MCNGTPFSCLSREVRALVLTSPGSERGLSPRADVVLEVVWMAVKEQFPTLMHTLYPDFEGSGPADISLVGCKVEGS